MPGRSFVGSNDYRYGAANGQEKDDEISGAGNSYSAEFWQYDSRLGRRWNIDPITKPNEAPYAAFANNPIWFVDKLGNDTSYFCSDFKKDAKGNPIAHSVVKGGADAFFYQHDQGTRTFASDKYIQVNSPNSLLGHDYESNRTSDVLINSYPLFLRNFIGIRKQALLSGDYDLIGGVIRMNGNSGELDIAYNGILNILAGDENTKTVVTGQSQVAKFLNSTTLEENRKMDANDYFIYSNALFKLPNGIYANANEVGNYHIGFMFGFGGSGSPAPLAQYYSKLYNGTADEIHEQKIVNYSHQVGWSLRMAALYQKKK
jgi:hypothetical protein